MNYITMWANYLSKYVLVSAVNLVEIWPSKKVREQLFDVFRPVESKSEVRGKSVAKLTCLLVPTCADATRDIWHVTEN